jgi:rfaE bifunctional protein nucleotidyltransferase chain/domain/rfaE bifunctional protein kinase chain/domain
VVVGDVLADVEVEGRVERVCPDAPVPVVDETEVRRRPGGAGLAACLAARGDTAHRWVVLVTALADDEAGRGLRALLESIGVDVVDLGLRGATPEKIRVRAAGQSLLRLDRGGDGSALAGALPAAGRRALSSAAAVLVADYGRGLTRDPGVRDALEGAAARVPLVWDPHPRGTAPVPGTWLATPNASEAERVAGELLAESDVPSRGLRRVTRVASLLSDLWPARAVAVTMSEQGALLVNGGGPPLVVPPPEVATGDPCGAGDRFAAAATAALADGAVLSEAVQQAVAAASRFVAAGGASAFDPEPVGPRPASEGADAPGRAGGRRAPHPAGSNAPPRATPASPGPPAPDAWARARAVVEEVRAAGGTVVATGGCFDLLHAGHVSLLDRARRLGACLVVCLNSDASVRALKGPGRPVVTQADRRRVLEALASVDAVAVFDEPTPERVLRELRPDVFVKGGDYAGASMVESEVLEEWAGQVVVLPYLDGRSTTDLLQQVLAREP